MKNLTLAIGLVLASSFAYADLHEVDMAASEFEGVTEHFHETVHHDASGSHLDTDAHELAERATWFHEEVHHGHPLSELQHYWYDVKGIYQHTSHTYYSGWSWSSHIREDWRLVRNGYYNVEHALYWHHPVSWPHH